MFTSSDSGYRTARDMKAHGVHVEAIIDARSDAPAIETDGVPVLTGAVVTNVDGGKHGMKGDRDRPGQRPRDHSVPVAGHVRRLEPGGAPGLSSGRAAVLGRG